MVDPIGRPPTGPCAKEETSQSATTPKNPAVRSSLESIRGKLSVYEADDFANSPRVMSIVLLCPLRGRHGVMWLFEVLGIHSTGLTAEGIGRVESQTQPKQATNSLTWLGRLVGYGYVRQL